MSGPPRGGRAGAGNEQEPWTSGVTHCGHLQPPLFHRLDLKFAALCSGCSWGNDFRACWRGAIFFSFSNFPIGSCWRKWQALARVGAGRERRVPWSRGFQGDSYGLPPISLCCRWFLN